MANNKNNPITNTFTGLPIKNIIGGPLVAAARANSMMGMEQVKFLMDTCFTKDKKGGYTPVMINMVLIKNEADYENSKDNKLVHRQVKVNFQLPMLTLIPMSSLAVESLEVDFDVEIKSQFEVDHKGSAETTSTDKSNKNPDENHFNPSGVELKGVISYDSEEKKNSSDQTHYGRSNSSKLSVRVKANNLPLPVGVTTLLGLFSKSIVPSEVKSNDKSKNNDKIKIN